MLRPPQAADFYPGDLRAQVRDFLSHSTVPELPRTPVIGVVPHAGWAYSGQVAARVFHTLFATHPRETIVLLGSVHVPGVERPALYSEGTWLTPVGPVLVDEELSQRILEVTDGRVEANAWAHQEDHALEVQCPFIRLMSTNTKIVPIAFPWVEDAREIGAALGQLLSERPEVAVVCSTDLTHYGDRYGFAPAGDGEAGDRWMRANDARMVSRIQGLDDSGILKEAGTHHNACGAGALTATLAAAIARGAREAHVLEYRTSHDRTPDAHFDFGVGYVGAVA